MFPERNQRNSLNRSAAYGSCRGSGSAAALERPGSGADISPSQRRQPHQKGDQSSDSGPRGQEASPVAGRQPRNLDADSLQERIGELRRLAVIERDAVQSELGFFLECRGSLDQGKFPLAADGGIEAGGKGFEPGR